MAIDIYTDSRFLGGVRAYAVRLAVIQCAIFAL